MKQVQKPYCNWDDGRESLKMTYIHIFNTLFHHAPLKKSKFICQYFRIDISSSTSILTEVQLVFLAWTMLIMYNVSFPVWLLEVEKNLSVNQSKCRIFSYFKHLPNLLVTSSIPNVTAMSYGDSPLFSLYKEFNFTETIFFPHIYFISLNIIWWNYIITVTMHTTLQWEEMSEPQEHPGNSWPNRTLTREWAVCFPGGTEGTKDPGNHLGYENSRCRTRKKPAAFSRASLQLTRVSPGKVMSCLEKMSVSLSGRELLCLSAASLVGEVLESGSFWERKHVLLSV